MWGSFPLFTYFWGHNSCFNWILLCLIFCFVLIVWLQENDQGILLILSITTLAKYSIHLVSVWSFVSPFELLSTSIFIWTWCLSMSVNSLFLWMLISLFLEPSTICCCMNFYLALESREYSHNDVGWIEVGESNVCSFILCLIWG